MTKKPAQIFHLDLYGKRDDKYTFLDQNNMASIKWQELHPQMPELFFVPKDFEVKDEYDEGFSVTKLFPLNNVGIVTSNDKILINENRFELIENINRFYNIEANESLIKTISYRPFDIKNIYYDLKLIERGREKIMNHFLKSENIGLVLGKQCVSDWRYIFISKNIGEFNLTSTAGRFGSGSYFPLYLYPEKTEQQSLLDEVVRTPNLNMEIVNQMAEQLGIGFVSEKTTLSEFKTLTGLDDTDKESPNTFAPIDILDYIYAVLHSPNYREKYKEFLKIDFPRVPFPTTLSGFRTLTALGAELRQIHLLESETIENYITEYPEDGDNVVGKPKYEQRNFVMENDTITHNDTAEPMGRVYINDTQYFDNVPEVAWNFYIGGYQPAQKWLKDRKERELSFEDILHYQKIIVALSETDRIMKEIDTIEI